jgi:hypothetical protein
MPLAAQSPDEAAKTLRDVKLEDLSQAEQVDYAYALAMLAIETAEQERLEQAKALLKAVNISDPIFRERRDALLLNVQEAITSGSSKTLVQHTRRIFADRIRSATSYLILKPSFMGVGVDVGKIFEDLSRRREARVQEQSDDPHSPDEPLNCTALTPIQI